MTQKQELIRLEKQIKKTARYFTGSGLAVPMSQWDGSIREALENQFSQRQELLNSMFRCTEEELADFIKTNDRLFYLTRKTDYGIQQQRSPQGATA